MIKKFHNGDEMKSLAAIIITVYNKENYFDACLQSVLTQKCSYPFVVILSDDGSTDSSAALCRTYAERYSRTAAEQNSKASAEQNGSIAVENAEQNGSTLSKQNGRQFYVEDITDGEHRGVVGNYLYCLQHALDLGVKYISQIDCDDILADENFLSRQISFLESNEEAQVATSGFFLINEK
ncbi:MAG: glycosyltransferase family 2 protein, partial [Bacteroidales bacterium]|nr:glycosyltransferase family 2 protein [Bacteroidales bacterium]